MEQSGKIDIANWGWPEKRTVIVRYEQPFVIRPSVTLLPHKAYVSVVEWDTCGFVAWIEKLASGAWVIWQAAETEIREKTAYEKRQELGEAWTEFCNVVKEELKLDILLDWIVSKIKFLKRKGE